MARAPPPTLQRLRHAVALILVNSTFASQQSPVSQERIKISHVKEIHVI